MFTLFLYILIHLSLRDIIAEQQSISPRVTVTDWAASLCQ